jgi:hypothetical protein
MLAQARFCRVMGALKASPRRARMKTVWGNMVVALLCWALLDPERGDDGNTRRTRMGGL